MDELSNLMKAPRVLIAGERSGIGKSTVTVGILLALKEMGLDPQPYKSGPDFLDPMHHDMMLDRKCRNLDTWMFPEAVMGLFQKSCVGSGVSVIEGVMGMYDGVDGRSEEGSSAHLSKVLDAPVILVTDASGSARSVGAVVEGFKRYDPDVNIGGVIANKVGSKNHESMVKDSIRDVPFIGGLPRSEAIGLKSRHLGLVPAKEQFSEGRYDAIRNLIEDNLDMDLLVEIARSAPDLEAIGDNGIFGDRAATVRLGVARDDAFNFYYQDNLDILISRGAEIVEFSPLKDPLPDVDGLYFGGGFPELFAQDLADNDGLMNEIRECSSAGMPIYAECGGMMYLTKGMSDLEGRKHTMCGIFDAEVSMTTKLQALSYVQVDVQKKGPMASVGDSFRGHEFHYSHVNRVGDVSFSYHMARGRGIKDGMDGMIENNTLASYTHLHLGNRPSMASNLVDGMEIFKSGHR